MPERTALLKGRGSYLCVYRMNAARQNLLLGDGISVRTLAEIEQWSHVTQTGDLAELLALDVRSSMIPLITSTRDNFLGSQWPQSRYCHVNHARREAMGAVVVVINHHLFFADLAVRESGVAEFFPSMMTVVFDEAHRLIEAGIQFLGNDLTTGQLVDFSMDLLAAGLSLVRGFVDWHGVVGSTERAARVLRLCVGKHYAGTKLRWIGKAPEGISVSD